MNFMTKNTFRRVRLEQVYSFYYCLCRLSENGTIHGDGYRTHTPISFKLDCSAATIVGTKNTKYL